MSQIIIVARFEKKSRLAAFISLFVAIILYCMYNPELDASIRWRMHNRLFLATRKYGSKKVFRWIWLCLFLQVV